MTAAAISGTFADFRTVKGRKVAQLVIEVAIEQADAALQALGGVPQPHDPKWVAIARMDLTKAAAPEPKERKAWADLPPSQQCAIRCGEREFQEWLGVSSAEEAGQSVRDLCGCRLSRKELDEDQRKRVLWHQTDRSYLESVGRLPHG